MKLIEAAYVAGIIDGEGHIGIYKTSHKRSINNSYVIRVNVTNTNIKLLNYLLKITNIGIIKSRSKENDKWKQCYTWSLRVSELSEFLKEILPYLIIKKKQAELVIEFLEKCNNPLRQTITKEIVALREIIYEELIVLNTRGN